MPKNGERKKVSKSILKQLILVCVVFGLITAGVSVYTMLVPGFEYQREVHGHMENAYYADEPYLMKDELTSVIEGMNNLGLEDDMYGTIWYWEKTPNRRMDYQYKHLNGIIDRIDSVIVWYETTYLSNGTSTEQLGDVFETKMDNLREFLIEDGWSDWIAEDSFYVNYYVWLILFDIAWWWIFAGCVIYFVYLLIRGMNSNFEKVYVDKSGKWEWYNYNKHSRI